MSGHRKGKRRHVLLQVVVLHDDGVVDGGEDALRAGAHEQRHGRRGVRRRAGGRRQRAAQHARAQHQLAQPRHQRRRRALRRAQPHRQRLHSAHYS